MGYNDILYFRGQLTQVMEGDRLVIRQHDSAVRFFRQDIPLAIQVAGALTTGWYLHFGFPMFIDGFKHAVLAGSIAEELGFEVKMAEYTTQEAVYVFRRQP